MVYINSENKINSALGDSEGLLAVKLLKTLSSKANYIFVNFSFLHLVATLFSPHVKLEYNKIIRAQRHTYVIPAHKRLSPAWPTEEDLVSNITKLKFCA